MIQPNELRIGNYIKFCGKPTKVWALSEDDINDEMDIYIEPITLTDEVLVKCGFVKIGVLTLSFENFLFEIGLNGDDFVKQKYTLRINGCLVIKVKYIHQLQNIFYSLTGKELEVKL